MELRDLFEHSIVGAEEGKIIATARFNKEHPVYLGHFPGAPVTPGVCQLWLIRAIVSEVLGKPLMLGSARDIKFLSMHNPFDDEELSVEISYRQNGDAVEVNATLADGERKVLKLNGEYRDGYGL